MGNKCCIREAKIERTESTNPALQAIREAQRKYFNSHIESDLDDSDDEEDREDSTDAGLYGSESSLITGDDNSLDNTTADSSIIAEAVSVLGTANINQEDRSSIVIGNNNVNNNNYNKEGESIVPPAPTATTTAGDVADSSKSSGSKSKPVVVKRREKAKYIRLSKRADFFSIFNTEDKKARSVDPRLYQYPFENIVFEGGGNKGLAYCGAVRVSNRVLLCGVYPLAQWFITWGPWTPEGPGKDLWGRGRIQRLAYFKHYHLAFFAVAKYS